MTEEVSLETIIQNVIDSTPDNMQEAFGFLVMRLAEDNEADDPECLWDYYSLARYVLSQRGFDMDEPRHITNDEWRKMNDMPPRK